MGQPLAGVLHPDFAGGGLADESGKLTSPRTRPPTPRCSPTFDAFGKGEREGVVFQDMDALHGVTSRHHKDKAEAKRRHSERSEKSLLVERRGNAQKCYAWPGLPGSSNCLAMRFQ